MRNVKKVIFVLLAFGLLFVGIGGSTYTRSSLKGRGELEKETNLRDVVIRKEVVEDEDLYTVDDHIRRMTLAHTTVLPEHDPEILQLQQDIIGWKDREAHGSWWECGELKTRSEMLDDAFEWAFHIVTVSREASLATPGYTLKSDTLKYSGAIESAFDRCALGRSTREWAFENKLLKPKKRTISYSKKDVLRVVKSWKFKKRHSAVDIGAYQLLWPNYYRGPVEHMLDLEMATQIGASQAIRWGRIARTDTPEDYWWGWTKSRIAKRKKTLRKFRKKL